MAAIYDEMSERAPLCRAVAVVSLVQSSPNSVIIHVHLEHRDGMALAAAVTYQQRLDGDPDYGVVATTPSERRVWT